MRASPEESSLERMIKLSGIGQKTRGNSIEENDSPEPFKRILTLNKVDSTNN